MILADAVAVAMFAGVIAYTLFAGADFGSGYYVLTAGSGVRGIEIRTLVDRSTASMWAANNVWLIFVLLTWWTAFPTTFAAAMTTLLIPLLLALAGIALREPILRSVSTPPLWNRRGFSAHSSLPHR